MKGGRKDKGRKAEMKPGGKGDRKRKGLNGR